MFCPQCGTQNTDTAVFCGNCGGQLSAQAAAPQAAASAQPATIASSGGKSKAVAVILAVIFSFFTWLYTYKKDKMKFWIGVAGWVVTVLLSMVTPGLFIIGFAIWVWGIIDTVRKPDAWYKSY